MKFFFKAHFILYILIAFAGWVNFAIGLQTMRSIAGVSDPWAELDLLRMTSSFYLALGFYIACCLLPSPVLIRLRYILVLLLSLVLLVLAHLAAVAVQLTSEAGTMFKAMFYASYIGINPQSFRLFSLILAPVSLLFLLAIVYFYCLEFSNNKQKIKKRFLIYFFASTFFLLQGMLIPLQKTLAYSLSHHPILYFLKTGYFPKKQIYQYQEKALYQSLEVTDDEVNNSKENKKNIVLIILESFRKEMPGRNGDQDFHKTLMPFLTSLAKQNTLVFENAFVTVPHTSKALVGIHCGILPFLDIPVYESTLGIPVECFPKILSRLGYKTVYFQSPTEKYENRRELMQEIGYEEIYSAESLKGAAELRVNLLGFEDRVLLKPSFDWLMKHKENELPFVMTFLTGTTHRSYQPPEYYKKNYYDDSELINNYINAVRYTDEFLFELFENFKKADAYENSIFILLSDHGEAFSEHGINMHNNVAYNEVANIFMMIHDPSGNIPGGRFRETVSQAQTATTILDLLGVAFSSEISQTFPSIFKSSGYALSVCYEALICASAIEGKYKYIFNFNEKAPELYNLEKDPLELENIALLEPERVAAMHAEFMRWYDFHQSAYHNYYLKQSPEYLDRPEDTVLHNLFDMHRSLGEIWPKD